MGSVVCDQSCEISRVRSAMSYGSKTWCLGQMGWVLCKELRVRVTIVVCSVKLMVKKMTNYVVMK